MGTGRGRREPTAIDDNVDIPSAAHYTRHQPFDLTLVRQITHHYIRFPTLLSDRVPRGSVGRVALDEQNVRAGFRKRQGDVRSDAPRPARYPARSAPSRLSGRGEAHRAVLPLREKSSSRYDIVRRG